MGTLGVLFLLAHHITTEERDVICFIEGAVRELQNRLRAIFLARDKAIAVEFEARGPFGDELTPSLRADGSDEGSGTN